MIGNPVASGAIEVRGNGGGTDSALVVIQASKTFGTTRALRTVDLDVAPGEIRAIVGQNGSGKSTLIKLLAGYHQPDQPTEVAIRGRSCGLGDGNASHRLGLRFVHQDLGVVSSLSSVDNLALGHGYALNRAGGIRWSEQRKRAREALSALGYDIDVGRPMSELAPVERTAVAIARALQGMEETKASVLVLDEPTATMPEPEVLRLFDVVRTVRNMGTAVLYVSHHLDEVFAIADQVTVFRDGEVVDTRPIAGLDRRELVRLMIGREVRPVETADAIRNAEPILEVEGLVGGRIRNLDLAVAPGEILGIAGITGSGRESVCQLLFGGSPRHAGTVRIKGTRLNGSNPADAIANRVGFVPANRLEDALFTTMSVRENLTIASLKEFWRVAAFRPGAEKKAVSKLVSDLGVRPAKPELAVEALSGGNQQKTVVGRWLATNPDVLLLDEPTQGVDVAAQADIHRLVSDAAASGAAVLVSSSDEVELARLCHRVLVMREGRLVAELCRPHISSAEIAQESLGASEVESTNNQVEGRKQ